MGVIFQNLSTEELCDLMCGSIESDFDEPEKEVIDHANKNTGG